MTLDAKTRAWIYRVCTAAVPLLVALGVTTDGIAQQVLNVVAAILSVSGTTLALKNVTPDN